MPASSQMAHDALKAVEESGLNHDQLEVQRLNAVGQAIIGTIQRTGSVMHSVEDPDNKRYVITSQVWESQLPILRRVDIIDVNLFQIAYQKLHSARADYNVVVSQAIAYLDAVRAFFENKGDLHDRLAAMLAAERLFFEMQLKYLSRLADEMSEMQALKKNIDAASKP